MTTDTGGQITSTQQTLLMLIFVVFAILLVQLLSAALPTPSSDDRITRQECLERGAVWSEDAGICYVSDEWSN